MSDTAQEYRLSRLGLRQEFKRDFNLLASFGLSYVIMSPLLGISSDLSYAWATGGPAPAIWGWKIATVGSLFIGLSMAEIVSGLPSSGGPFFWSSWLGGRHGPVLSYTTGWLNLFGQISLTAGNAAGAVSSLAAIASMLTGVTVTNPQQFGLQLGILALGGTINSCKPTTVARFLAAGIFVNFAGVVFVALLLPAVAPWRQGPKFVFATFFDRSLSAFNVPSNAYMYVQGITMCSFTIAGFDSCAHISEETKGADASTPLAIVWSIVAAGVTGYALLLSMIFCIQSPDPSSLLDPSNQAQGYAAGQLVWDAFQARFGSGMGSASVLSLFALAGIMCTIASLTSNGRCIFAFARSKGIPCSSFCHTVSKRTQMPVRAVWVAVGGSVVMSLTILSSPTAFGAITAASYASLLVSYAIPIFCRLTLSRTTFEPGPFQLGCLSMTIGWIALFWALFSALILCLPTNYPVAVDDNPMSLGIVFCGALAAWYAPRVNARRWYLDPKRQAVAARASLLVRTQTLIRTETI